ncbi:hypothetical protein AAC387_Pa07g3449 [Persea americana]
MGFSIVPLLSPSLVVLAVFLGELFMTVQSTTHPSDIQALRDLLQAVDPTSIPQGSCLSSWDFSSDPCDSSYGQRFSCGIRCDLNDSGLARVTELALDSAGYSGPLSLSPGRLPFLGTLDVADNRFSGPLPPAISNLTRLSRLSLSRNSFSGQIPPDLSSLSDLQHLYLDNNLLYGQIPPALGSGLRSLVRLELQSNRLSGEFPDLSGLKNLAFVDASDNLLSGQVFLRRFPPSIVQISMRDNQLEGELSEGISDLPLLQVVDLSHNRLSGKVPAAVFEHPSLEQVTLSYNGLSSVGVPAGGGRGSGLIAVDLGHNRVEGLVPAFMGLMPRLSALSLESNRLTGMIPAQYGVKAAGDGLAPFERLILSGNYLFGPIPGLFMGLKPGSAMVSLVDNCLLRCPNIFFFCQGGSQKSWTDCYNFSPVIP